MSEFKICDFELKHPEEFRFSETLRVQTRVGFELNRTQEDNQFHPIKKTKKENVS